MKATQINKPNIKAAEALAFASESTETIEQAKTSQDKKNKATDDTESLQPKAHISCSRG